MRLFKRPRLIPLIATFAVMTVFILTFLFAGPFRSPETRDAVMPNLDVRAPAPPPQPSQNLPAMAVSEPPPPPEAASPGEPAAEAVDEIKPVEVSLPKLAYAYALGFRLDGGKIAAAQDAHRQICIRMGPARCQLLEMRRGEADDAETSAMLKLRVASSEADRFSDALVRSIAKAGGRAIRTDIVAEDVSKQVVDAVARIRQREMLVARLTDILRSRRGTVAELVDAERSVASAQEELDQARAWLAELRGRVAMSNFEIAYQAVAPQAAPAVARDQLGESISGSGAAFLIAMRSLLTLLIYLVPWMLLVVPLILGVRALIRRATRDTPPPSLEEAEPA
ncbi:DUF4349 domain-containing protein [Sphingomonas sp. LB-2]|uniref:DUF4349 domain-containing protein n=1 Tax=Sphingomonas caeni TaxID=2984949 RepID=UPI00222F29F8|nr:DUF4349 domain-containing protein [Sphingomonas caeni]MCW3848189.1 DUF4349 domain-containing protein [Sphingomonas caeni]